MGERSFALRIGEPPIVARYLLNAHHNTFRTFWRWSDAAVDTAVLTGRLHTVFGWPIHVTEKSNPRSLRNFLMQGNGSEAARLAMCLATERGLEVCGSIHDAFLICAPTDHIDEDVAKMREAMNEASRTVLGGFEIRTDVKIVRYPERFMDEDRGRVMWDKVLTVLAEQQLVDRKAIA